MRTILKSIYTPIMVIMTCLCASVCLPLSGEAAERVIRPRRLNRSGTAAVEIITPAVTVSPAVSVGIPAPRSVPHDAADQSPAPPPDTVTTYPLPPKDPPPEGHARKSKKRRWLWSADTEREKQSEFAEGWDDPEFEPDFGRARGKKDAEAHGEPKDREAAKSVGLTDSDSDGTDSQGVGLPPYVSYEQYQEMNLRRLDFDAPLRITGGIPGERPPSPAGRSPFGDLTPPGDEEDFGDFIEEPAEEEILASEVPAEEIAEDVREEIPAEAVSSVSSDSMAPPAPSEVEDYRRRLEFRLLERYNNMPEHAGNVAKVSVVLSKPLQPSLDGTRLRAEFDQMVYDPWGKRISALEKEYYVVTFGAGGVRQVRSDPSVRIGLNMEREYAEAAEPGANIADRIRTLPSGHSFRANPSVEAPKAAMPDWWRPEYADEY